MRASDLEFARSARSHGWIAAEACESVLAEADRLQALGLEKGVDDVLVERRLLTPRQVHALREELGWAFRSPRLGDYVLLRRIGVGGSGVVFEARHVRLKQRVALKVLLPRLAAVPELRTRFLREGTALAKLKHPHLVHAIDAGQDGEHCYLALEFVEGENAQQLVARRGPVEPWRSLSLVRAVAQALQVLEEHGLLHCDIKPANVILEHGSGQQGGSVRLVDLGLATTLDEGSEKGALCGSPHYMAPERIARVGRIDSRSDLYSLAATWFYLLVGRPPFVGETTRAILDAHLNSPVPALRMIVPQVTERMARTVERWLAKDPAMRPESCSAALHELRILERAKPEALSEAEGESLRTPEVSSRKLSVRLVVGLVMLAVAGGLFALVWGPWSSTEDDELSGRRGSNGNERETKARPPREIPVEGRTESESRVSEGGVVAEANPAMARRPAAPQKTRDSATDERAGLRDEARGVNARGKSEQPKSDDPIARESTVLELGSQDGGPVLLEEPQAEPDPSSSSPGDELAHDPRTTSEKPETPADVSPLEARRDDPPATDASSEPLAGTFMANEVQIDRDGEPPWNVRLVYEFDDARELEDFRSRGEWKVEDSRLKQRSSVDVDFDSVAWFRLPLTLTVELVRPVAFVVGFSSVRVAPGQAGNSVAWFVDDGSAAARREIPLAAGTVRVEFSGEGVQVTTEELEATFDLDVPKNGRVVVELAPGGEVDSLRLEGALNPVWAVERSRLLEDLRQAVEEREEKVTGVEAVDGGG